MTTKLQEIVRKLVLETELKDKISVAVEAAFRELDPKPPERPIQRRKLS